VARYHFDGEEVRMHISHKDVDLLGSLTDQLVELLSDGVPEQPAADRDDPFALWEADLQGASEEPEDVTDPALRRLFPNPYPHDPKAASDYRRYTENESRRRKIDDAEVVGRALLAGPPIRVPLAELSSWLKTLNALRLVLASRLGIDDAEAMEDLQALPDDDPRVMVASIMDWLAYLQGVLIELTDPDE
jgi:hypothetical protein